MFHFICYNLVKQLIIWKKVKNTKKWTEEEEKYKIIKPSLNMEISTFQITKDKGLNNGMINNWIKVYREKSYEGLIQ